jgi:hypothetical protein
LEKKANRDPDTTVPISPSPRKHALVKFNFIFSMLLRSPLHRILSRKFLLLFIKGRKTGKIYTFPVGYLDDGDELQVIAVRGWWKNLQHGDIPVTVLLKGQKREGIATVYYRDERVSREFGRLVEKFPSLIRMYHLERDAQGRPGAESVHQAARSLALVRIRLRAEESL